MFKPTSSSPVKPRIKKRSNVRTETKAIPDELVLALKEIRRMFGEDAIYFASEYGDYEITYISSGVAAIDFGMCGGFARGRIHEVSGPDASGKSTVVLKTIAAFQEEYPDGAVAFVDVEGTTDVARMRDCGADPDGILYSEPVNAEEAGDICKFLLKKYKGELLLVVDSIAAMVPTAELDADVQQQFMGLQARLVGKILRSVNSRMKRVKKKGAEFATVILVNQIREKIGAWGDPEDTPGGRALKHHKSTAIRLRRAKTIVNQLGSLGRSEEKRKVRETVGLRVAFEMKKNKAGGPEGAVGEFRIYHKGNKRQFGVVDNARSVADYAILHGLIKGSRTFKMGKRSWKGRDMLIAAIRKSPKLYKKLYDKVLAAERLRYTGGK